VQERPGYEFWPDSLSYAEADLPQVQGHREVTDAYLVSLAAARPDARLATLDEGLARARPETAILLPTL
jgi:predicted nucleic acid-binding protein